MSVIRKVQPSDKQAYLALVREFYDSDAVLIRPSEDAWLATFDEMIHSDTYVECFLVEHEGTPAGFALIAKTFSQEAGGMVLWLEELYIQPGYRGFGLGGDLISFLSERYNATYKRMRLEIEPENEGAVRLYRRHGFEDYPYSQMKADL
ncbi:MAG: GNAT family N-acetyltransferase [Clostridia bacterium]